MKRKGLANVLLWALIVATCCNCGSREQRSETEVTPGVAPEARTEAVATEGDRRVFKGYAVFGHEVRSLRLCGSQEALWAIDSTGLIWELHQQIAPHRQLYEELFVVVQGRLGPAMTEGFGAEYPGKLVVDQVLYMAREGFDCGLDLDKFHYRIYGNEPFWSIEISAHGIELKRPGGTPHKWGNVRREQTEEGIRYLGNGSEPFTIEIVISGKPCRDTMSDTFFAYTASVLLGGEMLKGCALKGTGQGP